MNANEFADKLDIIKNKIIDKEHEFGKRAIILYTEAATMLRQQQAEIKELKAKLQLHEAMDNQCASLMQQFRKAQ